MAKLDPNILAHLEWLGFVQPTGLVVSAPALVRAGAILDRNDSTGQDLLRSCLDPETPDDAPEFTDFEAFARTVLGWTFSDKGFAGTDDHPIPAELHIALPDYGETLVPTYAVRELNPDKDQSSWQLLVTVLKQGTDLDAITSNPGGLEASPHGRMERLLRETGVAAGLLSNGRSLRIISAPRGESSGWLQFEVEAMAQTAGRPICSAMRLLLRQQRLLVLPKEKRLAALLEDSRKFQNEVSEKLSEQVLHSLYELLRGFQAAHEASGSNLLRDPLADDPDDVYRALLTVILRLVFLLYAEERQMLPTEDETFSRYYSLAGLFSRLRDHAGYFPDTMDQRYGAWAQLTVLFRMVHDGADAGNVKLPPRNASLFDPNRYPFLEGRRAAGVRQITDRIEPPRVSDGTIYRVLEKLLVLDGERLSYRALDVEQIGSVYQTMMGFRLETMYGRSLSLKPKQRMGAPSAIDLDELIELIPTDRGKWLKKAADRDIPAGVQGQVRDAETVDQLHSALGPIVDRNASPDLQPAGSMVLQPSDERRRSGSHYTPRALTEPIVRTTLQPVLEALVPEGGTPTSEQILELKVCDPAMGSAAFLVEACRQLGDSLIEAWGVHGNRPEMPADEDEVIFARRLVVQRCIYGVDRNEIAVDLAKMSLWLATLAREHPLTFVDHALRHGDALVGLDKKQIQSFHWDSSKPPLAPVRIAEHVARVGEIRELIRSAGENVSDFVLRDMWDEANRELQRVRVYGDLTVLAFFSSSKTKGRELTRAELVSAIGAANNLELTNLHDQKQLVHGQGIIPFHWEIEFPEVFQRDNPGFDLIVGNPPFAGKNTLIASNPKGYLDWLKQVHSESSGFSDLAAHFFRRSFEMLRNGGTFGLISTNTISQGDTRFTGLRWICTHGGNIFEARRRLNWPGLAAVIVSVVHVIRGNWDGARLLDGQEVGDITAFLFHAGSSENPTALKSNANVSFIGSYVLGAGFTFDDSIEDDRVTPIDEMKRLLLKSPVNQEVIFPYIGGEEVNSSPALAPHRYVINFAGRTESECRAQWPDLMSIIEEKVRPLRARDNAEAHRRNWWQFARRRVEMGAAIADLDRVLVTSLTSARHSLAFLSTEMVFSHSLVVFATESQGDFALLQSRVHEYWARFFGSTMKDDPRYSPPSCFETFPFPEEANTDQALSQAGEQYYRFRTELMTSKSEGLTQIYNRFHDPEDSSPGIEELRELHSSLDRNVLDAYGWNDIPDTCEFLLDYDDVTEGGNRRRPWRYRWPDDVHDEVLARLLELNAERAAQESSGGRAADQVSTEAAKTEKMTSQSESLF